MNARPLDLASFAISRERGFVPDRDPLDRLPPLFEPWERVAAILPALLMNRTIRSWIADIPELRIDALASDAERERAFMLLSALTMAHVWGGESPDFTLPSNIAVPYVTLAKTLERPPIILHAAGVLNNWRRLDPSQPLALDNVDTQFSFTGSVDEKWFFLATLGVELAGAPMITALAQAVDRSREGSEADLEAPLAVVEAGIRSMTEALMRMRERCDPYVFYNHLRPYLAGWPVPGLTYAGTGTGPQLFAGGSAAQSSLLQSIDAGLGIVHEAASTRDFLRGMQQYMPAKHRAFIAALAERSAIRERAMHGSASLRDIYNACIAATDEFRRKHIGITSDYILKQANVVVGPGTTGTGGTDFVEFLRDSRIETARTRIT